MLDYAHVLSIIMLPRESASVSFGVELLRERESGLRYLLYLLFLTSETSIVYSYHDRAQKGVFH